MGVIDSIEMKNKTIFVLITTIIALVAVSGCTGDQYTDEPGDYDEFAQCLTEKGVKMYGTEWCSHCKNQKELFGNSFQYINFVDCDQNKDECQEAEVKGYPTWVIAGENYPGEQSFSKLASLSGCNLEENS